MKNTVLMHSAKGQTWGKHKYIAIKNGRYIYPSDVAGEGAARQLYREAREETRDQYLRDMKKQGIDVTRAAYEVTPNKNGGYNAFARVTTVDRYLDPKLNQKVADEASDEYRKRGIHEFEAVNAYANRRAANAKNREEVNKKNTAIRNKNQVISELRSRYKKDQNAKLQKSDSETSGKERQVTTSSSSDPAEQRAKLKAQSNYQKADLYKRQSEANIESARSKHNPDSVISREAAKKQNKRLAEEKVVKLHLHNSRNGMGMESGNSPYSEDILFYRKSDVDEKKLKAYAIKNGLKATVKKFGDKGKAFLASIFKWNKK